MSSQLQQHVLREEKSDPLLAYYYLVRFYSISMTSGSSSIQERTPVTPLPQPRSPYDEAPSLTRSPFRTAFHDDWLQFLVFFVVVDIVIVVVVGSGSALRPKHDFPIRRHGAAGQ
jgi:hypothetical protein